MGPTRGHWMPSSACAAWMWIMGARGWPGCAAVVVPGPAPAWSSTATAAAARATCSCYAEQSAAKRVVLADVKGQFLQSVLQDGPGLPCAADSMGERHKPCRAQHARTWDSPFQRASKERFCIQGVRQAILRPSVQPVPLRVSTQVLDPGPWTLDPGPLSSPTLTRIALETPQAHPSSGRRRRGSASRASGRPALGAARRWSPR